MNEDRLLNSKVTFWAGLAVAIGSFGVVLTSVFYALSPVSAALPIPGISIASTYGSMLSGRFTMMAAGIVGVPADVILITGTITIGLGSLLVFVSELKASDSILAKPLAWVGILFSLLGLVASVLYFAQIGLPQLIGISIAGVSLIFGIYGIQIARQSNS